MMILDVEISNEQGTITQYTGFDPEEDSKKLRNAMQGLGEW